MQWLVQRRYYSQVLPPSGTKDAAILDMCSSWVSHYPKDYSLGRISGKSHDGLPPLPLALAFVVAALSCLGKISGKSHNELSLLSSSLALVLAATSFLL